MTQHIKKPIAVLDFPDNPRDAIPHARAILLCYAAGRGTLLALVTPTPEALTAAVDALAAAEAAMSSISRAHTEARDTAHATCHTLFKQYTASVQALADASPATASQIIAAAGLRERHATPRVPYQLGVEVTGHSGEVEATAPTSTDVDFHLWEMSLDGGHTWLPQTPTTKAKTLFSGIAPGTALKLRHRAMVKGVLTDWGQELDIIVR